MSFIQQIKSIIFGSCNIQNCFNSKRYLLLSYLIKIFSFSFFAYNGSAQSTFQKKFFIANSKDLLTNTSFVDEIDSSTFFISNFNGPLIYSGYACISKINSQHGEFEQGKRLSISDEGFSVNNAIKLKDKIYINAFQNNSYGSTNTILKYNLNTNTIEWQKKIIQSDTLFSVNAITDDRKSNLYLLGSFVNKVKQLNGIFITKMDTNSNVIWTKAFASNIQEEYPSSINYNSERELYISSVGYESIFGRIIILRLDQNGNILDTKGYTTNFGPRFSLNFSGIVNSKLILVNNTLIGPSDPGPLLLGVFDSTLNLVKSKIITGVDPRSIYCNNSNLLISAQAPVTSGFIGFRSVRFDSDLNITGSRYFNKINTYSIASGTSCFINKNDQSYHFIKSGGFDTIYVVKTNNQEISGCNDTSFIPNNSVFDYFSVPYNYILDTINLKLTESTVKLADFTIESNNLCNVTSAVNLLNENLVFKIYPNPSKEYINIETKGNENFKVELLNLFGETLLTMNNQNEINISDLTKGLYIVKLTIGSLNYVQKLIKE